MTATKPYVVVFNATTDINIPTMESGETVAPQDWGVAERKLVRDSIDTGRLIVIDTSDQDASRTQPAVKLAADRMNELNAAHEADKKQQKADDTDEKSTAAKSSDKKGK